jgi:hypothetical protein
MATYRVSMQFPFDSTLPKDVISINPHYNATDPQALVNALAANLKNTTYVSTHPFTLKAYDAAKAPPSYPLAIASQSGTAPNSGVPREVAICLSYYSTYNRPRFRGRLFLPPTWFSAVANVRPTGAIISAALAFATDVLTKSLPSQTNWVVWSDVEKKSQGGVSDCWVDDEWDTIRSRGLSPTTRQTLHF